MASEIAHLGEPGVPCREGGSSTIWVGEPRPMLLAASDWRLRFCAGSRQLVDVSVSLCPADSSWSRPHRIVP